MDFQLQTERRDSSPLNRRMDHRDDFERDLARLIHSAAFRRLQAKTQVLGIGKGDFHRPRLTHSMEVAQIGKAIAGNLRNRNEVDKAVKAYLPDDDLVFFEGLAHDLGHPPFGHGGEIALNYSMREHGGFEGSGQTLRILAKLAAHTPQFGLNPTCRSLLAILKYPVCYSQVCRRKLAAETHSTKVIDHLEFAVIFADGVNGKVKMLPSQLFGVFESLKDPDVFSQLWVTDGFVSWRGKVDLAPDAMYEAIRRDGEWVLS
jgi:predicted deoxyguanosinetriphosphate triphosphohydrolase